MSVPKSFANPPRPISPSSVAPHGQLRSVLDNLLQGIILIDSDLRIEFCNQRFLQMYNVAPQPGSTLLDCFNDDSGGAFAGAFVDHIKQLGDAVKTGRAFYTITNLLDGRTISIVGKPIAPHRWLLIHEDVTERERTQERMIHMARHDALTGLPNRALLRERLEQELKRVKRGDGLAVMCLDLDLFKSVNDTLGHPIGDELLKCVADRLRGCTREPDMVARLGGDEFAIIMTQLQSPTDATALAQRIQGSIGQPYHIEEHQIVTGISIGIAVAPDDGMDADVLMKNADLALYGAKADGRSTYRFFETEMDARMKARRGLELDLRRAITAQALELHYQPLVSIRDNEITALEALLRWNHASRGVISPADFIPIAEETGLIIPIGEWVLRTACKEATRWPEHVKVAVNVSPAQLKSRQFLAMIKSAFAETKLPPHRLQLEITETVLMQDTAATFETLNALRTLGVQIALDDFGTGYSSLSYLRSFPFDKIKIDRSFIKDLANGKEPLAIVHAVADLANCLNMISTAEGVETQQQFDVLQSIGCSEMQGYLFSRAQPAKEVYKFFNEANRIVA
jgi:diguanylate cyclase (GGDEF)-like protein